MCPSCLHRFATPCRRCTRCALPMPDGAHSPLCSHCIQAPPPLDLCVATVDYEFPWNVLLPRFKFQAHLGLRHLLTELLHQTLDRAQTNGPDWVLPIPLHPDRLVERGYNQSWEIARGIAQRRQCASQAQLLQRIRPTPHQVGLGQMERAHNLQHAFVVSPSAQALLRDRHIALVDDVMTTGATLFEVARTLKAAGARRVDAWVLARTPANRTD